MLAIKYRARSQTYWGDKKNPFKGMSLASYLHVQNATVSDWLRGKDLCPLRRLAEIVDKAPGLNPPESAPLEKQAESQRIKQTELLRLLLLSEIERAKLEKNIGWTDSGRQLVLHSLQKHVCQIFSKRQSPKLTGRTLCDFPNSFYPLVVVVGDKREYAHSRINVADFGAVSSSPAELRWLLKLGLSLDVELLGDKVFVLENVAQLRERFGKKNLLVVGSPACNHLARRLLLSRPKLGWRRGVPIFRFNMPQHVIQQIETLLEDLSRMVASQLVGSSSSSTQDLRFWMRFLFMGGILDPTYRDFWVRALETRTRDFGLVTLARNPFCEDGDRYVCILASGFHMFGTAKALECLSDPGSFQSHPLGGIIRVDIDDKLPFAERFDQSKGILEPQSHYTLSDVKDGLKALRQMVPPLIHITKDEIDQCLEFVESL